MITCIIEVIIPDIGEIIFFRCYRVKLFLAILDMYDCIKLEKVLIAVTSFFYNKYVLNKHIGIYLVLYFL